ncbi:MAG: hypothetical protein OYH77_08390 [Pseudomonadota bacterium]|nr:hypothetical protein [Pseudomonadota bacterium]
MDRLATLTVVAMVLTIAGLSSCTRRVTPNNNGVVTLSDCLGKGMQFDANKRKCLMPDSEFCYSQMMIKGLSTCQQPTSQDDCDQIARNNSTVSNLKYISGRCSKSSSPTNPTGKRDTNIKITVTSRLNGAVPRLPNNVVLADVVVGTPTNLGMYQLTVMNYPNSGCVVSSSRDPQGTSKFIITGLPSATATSCNAKIVVISLKDGTYNTADIVANVAR